MAAGGTLDRLLRNGPELLARAGGKADFLQELADEQNLNLVMVVVGRNRGGEEQVLAQVCDKDTFSVVNVAIGTGVDKGQAMESVAKVVLRYFTTLYSASDV